jgi:transcriptional regulator with XRE-family HTH domain
MDVKARHSTLGSLLRSLRSRNRWTLKEMSERTDIPVSTLSKVEHDRLTLTYDKLVAWPAAQCPDFELFQTPPGRRSNRP